MTGPPSLLTIEGVLLFYQDEVVPALAAALTIDDKFPEEVLNEIRNAFTHLAAGSRCNGSKRQHELSAATRHLRRVCIDCLKVCIFTLAKRSELAVDALTYDLQLPEHVYQKMSDLRRRRQSLAAAEGVRSLENALGDYKSLANDYDEFYVSLDTQFAGETAEARHAARRKREFRRDLKSYFIGFILGLIAAVAGTWIYEKVFTESNSDPPAVNSNPPSPG